MACFTPIKVKNTGAGGDGYSFHHVPCGKCHHCKLRRVKGWILRLKHEQNNYETSHFVTFTYDQVVRSPRGLATLSKHHTQTFFKRLREAYPQSLKYYLVGEYGSQTQRPHYHAIIFGALQWQIKEQWENFRNYEKPPPRPPKFAKPPKVGKKPYIDINARVVPPYVPRLDGSVNGHVFFGENVTDAAVAYCAKYIDKGKLIPMFKGDDRIPEFSLMSKKMGLNFLTPAMIHYQKTVGGMSVKDGKYVMPLPRYYKDKIWDKENLADQKAKLLLTTKFKTQNETTYLENVKEHGGELEYIRALNARLWANQQSIILQNKLKRNKL